MSLFCIGKKDGIPKSQVRDLREVKKGVNVQIYGRIELLRRSRGVFIVAKVGMMGDSVAVSDLYGSESSVLNIR